MVNKAESRPGSLARLMLSAGGPGRCKDTVLCESVHNFQMYRGRI